MKLKPMLFAGPMVRALLNAQPGVWPAQAIDPALPCKWQSRRVYVTQVEADEVMRITAEMRRGTPNEHITFGSLTMGAIATGNTVPPYEVGDMIWVRETFTELLAVSPSADEPSEWDRPFIRVEEPTKLRSGSWAYDGLDVVWRADGEIEWCDGDGFSGPSANREEFGRWKPSIHMPLKYARLFLEVKAVRVERLQDISEEDAVAEGVEYYVPNVTGMLKGRDQESPRDNYRILWDSLNAKRGSAAKSWDNNPWVWVYELGRINKPDFTANPTTPRLRGAGDAKARSGKGVRS